MKLQVAIVEDKPEDSTRLNELMQKIAKEFHQPFSIKIFSSAESFLFECENNNLYDILLLDIEMGDISGIGLAKRIRKYDRRAEIIFITSHFELIAEGYEVDARHFLVKPVKEEKLKDVLSRAIAHLSIVPPSVMIKTEGEMLKLAMDKIIYVESFRHYLSVHTEDQEYRIKENISTFAEQLGDGFFKTHRSYLVALNRIVRISRTEVTLDEGTVVPLARGLYDAVNQAFIEQN